MWSNVPPLLRALLLGCGVFLFMQLGQVLLIVNAEDESALAWSVPVVMLFLYVCWKYFSGSGWPGNTQEARRRSMRVDDSRPSNPRLAYWTAAAILVHLIGLAMVTSSVIRFPVESFEPPAFLEGLSTGKAFAIVLMFALVAGVSEESGFRGYMQVSLERRYGATIAILLTAVIFWLAHYSHASFLHRAPILLSSGLLAGALAYQAHSLLPVILVHFAADAIGFTSVCGFFGFPRLYRVETIQDTGIHTDFVIAAVLMVLGGVASIVLLRKMARLRAG